MGLKNRPLTGYFMFGRRRGDMALMIDFTQKRAIVRANTALIDGGVALEDIPPGMSGYAPGMVLMRYGWQYQYFLVEREGWNEKDYFAYAEKLIRQKGIPVP